MRKETKLLEAQGGSFLLPSEVGSSVLWYVNCVLATSVNHETKEETPYVRVNGSIQLSDCSRMIGWGISDEEDIVKLDWAIKHLKDARAALKRARALYKKHQPKKRGGENE